MDDERLDRLGRYFCHFNIRERYGFTFEQFLHMVEIGTWEVFVA